MSKAIHHVGISTADIERCICFYRDMLGMEVISQSQTENKPTYDRIFGLSGVKAKSAMLRLGGMRLELWEFERPRGTRSDLMPPIHDPRITHLCFEVEDIEKEYLRLQAAGIHFHSAPQTFGTAKAVYGRDPEGNIFELVEW